MRLVLLACMLATGCTVNAYTWDFEPTVTLTPEARPELQERWTDAVTEQAEDWNARLVALGCPAPFVVGAGGYPLKLLPVERWHEDPKNIGVEYSSEILFVEAPAKYDGIFPPHFMIISHELGHTFGLGHSDPESSIMSHDGHIRDWRPSDATDAACALGCGPCE